MGCGGCSCREMAAWAKAQHTEQAGFPAQTLLPALSNSQRPPRESRDTLCSQGQGFWGIHLLLQLPCAGWGWFELLAFVGLV